MDYGFAPMSVHLFCHAHPELFGKRYERDGHGQWRACFVLKAPTPAP